MFYHYIWGFNISVNYEMLMNFVQRLDNVREYSF